MAKRVILTKVNDVTIVQVTYDENPNIETTSISQANLFIDNDSIVVDLHKKELSFKLADLVNNYGCTTLTQLLTVFAAMSYFTSNIQESQSDTGFITLVVPENSDTVQSDLLIGKSSIDLVVVANSPNQEIENYNPELGSFDFEVLAGESLTIFFTN